MHVCAIEERDRVRDEGQLGVKANELTFVAVRADTARLHCARLARHGWLNRRGGNGLVSPSGRASFAPRVARRVCRVEGDDLVDNAIAVVEARPLDPARLGHSLVVRRAPGGRREHDFVVLAHLPARARRVASEACRVRIGRRVACATRIFGQDHRLRQRRYRRLRRWLGGQMITFRRIPNAAIDAPAMIHPRVRGCTRRSY